MSPVGAVAVQQRWSPPPPPVPNPDWLFVDLDGAEQTGVGAKVSGIGLAFAWANQLPWHVLQDIFIHLGTAANYGTCLPDRSALFCLDVPTIHQSHRLCQFIRWR
jgi:hypothetical protein